jgi:transposase InsO family protein
MSPETKIPIIHVLHPAIEKGSTDILAVQDIETENSVDNQNSWMTPIIEYINTGTIPKDENPRNFRMKTAHYYMINGVLYRKSLAGPYLRCLQHPETNEVLKDIHEGECGNHTAGRSLYSKILRTGYYWPTMKQDAEEYAKKCDACQRHSNIYHQPAEPMYPVLSPWPFMKWGMDIVGPMTESSAGKKYFLAMTDYFSKWIEAEAYAKIQESHVISFIKRNILTRFGVPSEIICDNGSQFIGKKTTNFCERWGIKMITSTPVHPQANGQAESSNKIIMNNLKKRLGQAKGKWAEELPFVLWADRTTPKNATGQTPFALVFGAEAVLPTEMDLPTARVGLLTYERNKELLLEDLEAATELRERTKIRIAAYQQRIAKSYNKNLRLRRFQVGDLVLKKALIKPDGKLNPKWEGPYLIEAEAGKGSYWLQDLQGNLVPRAWNAIHLKTYHM